LGWFLLVILAVSTVQWTAVQFMATYCSTWGWLGPVKNMLTLGSPVCHFVNKLQMGLADHYVTIWVSAAVGVLAWFASAITSAQIPY
jgi:hypothetical protein